MAERRAEIASVGAEVLGLAYAYLAAMAGQVAEQEFRLTGAHYTAESIAHVLPILDEIEHRIAAGEFPR